MDIREKYLDLAREYSGEADREEGLLVRLSILRLVLFFGGILLIYFAFALNRYIGSTLLVTITILFLYIVKLYGKHNDLKNRARNLSRINADEAMVFEGDFSMFNNGMVYNDTSHDFSYDIDLFGDASLFQYLNRTVTGYGRELLSGWLANPYTISHLTEERQKCIGELSAKFGWRQEFLAKGVGKNLEKEGIETISKWITDNKEAIISKRMGVAVYLLPAISIILLVLTIFGLMHYSFLVTSLLLNLLVVGFKIRTTNKIHEELTGRYKYLESLADLLKHIANEKFESNILSVFNSAISTENRSGIVAMKQLGSIISRFDTRINLLVGFLLNAFLLWDLQCMRQLEEWKKNYREDFTGWLGIVGEFDAYVSLGNYAYNNQEFIFPVKTGDKLAFSAKEMGHPLIPSKKRICNDFSIRGKGDIVIVTGANMAGKSTFLRTVAVNLIIAMVGAPVCASEMLFSPMKIFTSMRTTDSLHSNESYFYAELKRLKILKERLIKEENLFFILDEILKGTNSDDKRMGSILFLKEIIGQRGTGLIATHDTSLGDMEKEYPGIIETKCIEIEVDGENIKFDYKIKPGIAKNKNAVLLMEQLGILDKS
jgi:hypothetical protein